MITNNPYGTIGDKIMPKIRVAFHKPKPNDWLGQGIRLWTGLVSSRNRTVGPYDHVEIWTEDEDGGFEYEADLEEMSLSGIYDAGIVGTSWTSTMRGDNNGTVKRPASKIYHNPEQWDFYEIELTDEQYSMLVAYMELEVSKNKGYSFRDIGKFFGLGFLSDKKRNICSEFVHNALHNADILDSCGVVSPRRLAYLLEQAGYNITTKEGK